MAENLFKTEINDISVSAVMFDEAFSMIKNRTAPRSPSMLKEVHQHSTYEIFFVLDGVLSVVTENGAMDCENSIVIIPPLMNHYTASSELLGNCMYFSISKSPKHKGVLFDSVSKRLSGGVVTAPLSDDEKFYVSHIAKALSGEVMRENIAHFIPLLFYEIFMRFAPSEDLPKSEESRRIKHINIIDVYISAHYAESITLSDLSRELYLCEKQISRIIRKEYGCSLSELINRRRLAVSCMLLKYTDMPICEIADAVGYEYENYFFTVFKKAYGITPLKYREENT